MKKIYRKFFIFIAISLIFFSANSFARIGADPGDVRIFSLANFPIKVRLSILDGKRFIPVSNESSSLDQGDYYTFLRADINKKTKLEGKGIYAELYSFARSQWTTPILIVEHYDNNETPFYQFTCWFELSGPHCWSPTIPEKNMQ